jgi:hypothetical protein
LWFAAIKRMNSLYRINPWIYKGLYPFVAPDEASLFPSPRRCVVSEPANGRETIYNFGVGKDAE